MADSEQNDNIILYDDEPDPLSMSEEKYFKVKEAYIKEVRNGLPTWNTQPISYYTMWKAFTNGFPVNPAKFP